MNTMRKGRGPYQSHTDASLRAEAAKYGTRKTFAKGNPGAYQTARKRGEAFFDDICAHMPTRVVVSACSSSTSRCLLGKLGAALSFDAAHRNIDDFD